MAIQSRSGSRLLRHSPSWRTGVLPDALCLAMTASVGSIENRSRKRHEGGSDAERDAARIWLIGGGNFRGDSSRPAFGQSAEGPIRIGSTLPLSGGLAGNGRPAFLAHQLWVEDVNAKGGLLGRKVELVNYDDQSNGGPVPALYTKLIEVDKVDLVISSYSTALIAPAMPVIMAHRMAFVTLLGSATNDAFQYDRTVNVSPTGGNMQQDFAKGFFEVAMNADPKPKTVAIAGLDSDFLQRSMKSARTQAKATGLETVYDKSYPPSTVDYEPDHPRHSGGKAGHRLSRLLSH